MGDGKKVVSGRQFVSWIHGEDFCQAVEWLIGHEEVTGGVNLAAPNPIPNRDMMRVLRRLCSVRLGLPATRWMLEVGAVLLRTETELVIKSRRVVPTVWSPQGSSSSSRTSRAHSPISSGNSGSWDTSGPSRSRDRITRILRNASGGARMAEFRVRNPNTARHPCRDRVA